MSTFPAASDCSAGAALQILCFLKMSFLLNLHPRNPRTIYNNLHICCFVAHTVKSLQMLIL